MGVVKLREHTAGVVKMQIETAARLTQKDIDSRGRELELEARGYDEAKFDFEQFILKTIIAVRDGKTLPYELHEKFEYIQADEVSDQYASPEMIKNATEKYLAGIIAHINGDAMPSCGYSVSEYLQEKVWTFKSEVK